MRFYHVVFLHFVKYKNSYIRNFALQAEYINRLDYKWKRQLAQEQEESSTVHMINKMLLQNILPVHVGKNYNIQNLFHKLIFSSVV
jgi:hypothetical protein